MNDRPLCPECGAEVKGDVHRNSGHVSIYCTGCDWEGSL